MKELRTLIFGEREAAQALIALCRRTKRSMPNGAITSFRLVEAGTVSAIMTVVDDFGIRHDLPFQQEEVAAALVQHCLDRRIPLPRDATKLITAVDGQIVLALEVSHRKDVKAIVQAAVTHHGQSTVPPGNRTSVK